jgi:hypothetical protein
LLIKQRSFPKLTSQIYIEKHEVKQYDGYSLVEPLIDTTKEPHKLHLIKKTKSIFGEPWWVRNALEKLGFHTKRNEEWKIVHSIKPNTPEINKLLWICKHCVKIKPIDLEKGVPTASDVKYTKINIETGRLDIIKKIDTIEIGNEICYKINDVVVSENKKPHDSFQLDKKELHRYMHQRKDLCQLNSEYFPTVYDYKYDQNLPGAINVKGLSDTRISEDE